MNLHNGHTILFLQNMVWHEGYPHGQAKLELKATGPPDDPMRKLGSYAGCLDAQKEWSAARTVSRAPVMRKP